MAAPGAAPSWNGGQMSDEAESAYKEYLNRVKQMYKEINNTSLIILVWGPGESDSDLYQKRLQIRDQLRGQGHAALFSEDIKLPEFDSDVSARTRELLQSLGADFIVILQCSPGSTAETHDFSGLIRNIGEKMVIFIDERAREGYSYTGLLTDLMTSYNCVETFEYPKDIRECLLTEKVKQKIKRLQVAKWMQGKAAKAFY